MKLKTKYFLLLICSLFFLKAEAKVTLTSIWGDNMVLQQQSEVTFYGRRLPENVCMYPPPGITVRFRLSAIRTDDGNWFCLPPRQEALTQSLFLMEKNSC